MTKNWRVVDLLRTTTSAATSGTPVELDYRFGESDWQITYIGSLVTATDTAVIKISHDGILWARTTYNATSFSGTAQGPFKYIKANKLGGEGTCVVQAIVP